VTPTLPPSLPLATLRALLDRLIPADDFPGALAAGVEHYILGQWRGDCAPESAALLAGLRQLDAEAAARRVGANFPALAPTEQDALLAELEAGRPATSWPTENSAATFFARMVELAHEGYYADPGNGGNLDAASWRMLGYDPRPPLTLPPGAPSNLLAGAPARPPVPS
jgi:hypothetical protein